MQALRYADFVDYGKLDPVKRMALELFEPTLAYPERLGIHIVPETLGATAVGYDFSGISGDWLLTGNVEGLGTKNRVADVMYSAVFAAKEAIAQKMTQAGARGLYRGLGKDTAAMSVNDQAGIGADVFDYKDVVSCGNSAWFSDDMERVRELLSGYRDAADEGRFAIPQGETPELRDVIYPETLDLNGASLGLIRPRNRLVFGHAIQPGDHIYGLGSSGIHANGLSKARKIAAKLPEGFFTPLGSGKALGEELLTPTHLYNRPVAALFDAGVDIHFLQPVTGHGWQKIARYDKRPFTYVIERVPEPLPVFQELIECGRQHDFDVTNRENYFVWNMGVGFVVIAPEKDGATIASTGQRLGLPVHDLGFVDSGPRQVLMPLSDAGKQVIYTP